MPTDDVRRVGIVGSEAAKFTPTSEATARIKIRELIAGASEVVSGACHLGGIDIWAKEEAEAAGIPVVEYPPRVRSWEAGYKPRNLQIAQRSTECHCITIDKLPSTYKGKTFPLCYHCGTKDHVKSGGCWTVKQAKQLGREGHVHVIKND